MYSKHSRSFVQNDHIRENTLHKSEGLQSSQCDQGHLLGGQCAWTLISTAADLLLNGCFHFLTINDMQAHPSFPQEHHLFKINLLKMHPSH